MIRALIILVLLPIATVKADIYRCAGPDGVVTFSQTPCSNTAEVVAMDAKPAASVTAAPECVHAMHFAGAAFGLMRMNMSDDEVIAEFGGIDSMGPGTRRLLDYVFLYRNTRGMTGERVAELAGGRCGNGGFGDVSCNALPESYTQAGGGCDGEFSASRARPQVDMFARNAERSQLRAAEAAALQREQSDRLKEEMERQARVRECRSKIQAEINQIEGRIQMGADPNGHRIALGRLREQLARCG